MCTEKQPYIQGEKIRQEKEEIDLIGLPQSMEIRKCRNCGNFVRVSESEYLKLCTCNGFCMMGKLTGDFSLYYEGDSHDCIGYIYSDPNEYIRLQEQKFNEKYREFRSKCHDHRTHFGKVISKNLYQIIDGLPEIKHEQFTFLHDNEKDILKKYFVAVHRNELYELYKQTKVSKEDYLKFIADLMISLKAKWKPIFDEKENPPNRGGRLKITTVFQGGL